MNPLFPELNPLHILVAGVAYWLIGALWFSIIAGDTWSAELEKHGVRIKEPSKLELRSKLVTTFLLNLLVAFGVSVLLHAVGIQVVSHAVVFGILLGICFAAATLGITYTWESRSLKLFLIDAAYPVIGITTCAVILALWS